MTTKHFLTDNNPVQLTTGAGVSNEDSLGRGVQVSYESSTPEDKDWMTLPAMDMFPKDMSDDGLWVKCENATLENPVPICEWM